MYKILLFLYANNFLTFANYFTILLVIYCFLKSRYELELKFSKVSCFLILSLLSYMLIYIINFGLPGYSTFFLRFLSPLFLYFVGSIQGRKGIHHFISDMLIIGFAQFCHGFANVLKNRNVNVLAIAGRQYQDIYGGSISATVQNLFFIIICSLLFYNIFCEKRTLIKILGLFAAIGGIYGTIANASRTLIYLVLICFFAAFFIYTLLYHGNKKNVGIWFIVIFTALLFVIIVWTNMFNIKGWFTNTALGQRLARNSISSITNNLTNSLTGNLRLKYAADILGLLFKYPMGIPYLQYSNYAHNLWLDIAKETGIIPLLLYIWYTILSIKIIINTIRKKFINKEAKVFIASLTIAFFIAFFVEPVVIGAPQIFAIYCFMIGYLSSISRNNEENIGNYENSRN